MSDQSISLARIRCGRCARLASLGVDGAQADRLRALGLCEGRPVIVLQSGERLILRVGGCRLGLHRDIAELVRVLPDGSSDTDDDTTSRRGFFRRRPVRVTDDVL